MKSIGWSKSVRQFGFFFMLLGMVSCLGVKASAWQGTAEPAAPAASEPAAASSDAVAKETPKKAAADDADDTAQFKQSPTVLGLGKMIGLGGKKTYWLAVILNFGIIALGVVYFSRLHLPTMFRNRTDSIRKSMDDAKLASDEAKRRLTEIEARLGRLDSDIAGMRATAEKDGAAEEARIRAGADDDKKKIVEAAEQEIATAVKSARRELGAYAADLAVNMARQRIHVDLSADQSLVSSFSKTLGSQDTGRGQ